jgi:hypothetical protein
MTGLASGGQNADQKSIRAVGLSVALGGVSTVVNSGFVS